MSSSPSPEVHAGDQSAIGDARLECQLDVTTSDHRMERVTDDKKGGQGFRHSSP